MQVSVSEAEGLISYRAEGHIDLAGTKKLCTDLFFLANQHAIKKILIDLRNTETDLTTAQFFQIIKFFGEMGLNESYRVALAYTPTEKDQWNLSFFETAAAEHGYKISLFTTMTAAVNWLHARARFSASSAVASMLAVSETA